MNRPVFGPERKTVGDPATTRLLDRLWPETDDERRDREQRALNEETYCRAIRTMWQTEETR